jgi:hypothetical protein
MILLATEGSLDYGSADEDGLAPVLCTFEAKPLALLVDGTLEAALAYTRYLSF